MEPSVVVMVAVVSVVAFAGRAVFMTVAFAGRAVSMNMAFAGRAVRVNVAGATASGIQLGDVFLILKDESRGSIKSSYVLIF